MPTPPPDQARSTAVEQLVNMGLSTYAARTFVALVGLGEGTAQDVSDVAEVPRTRVYDAVDELRRRGWSTSSRRRRSGSGRSRRRPPAATSNRSTPTG